MWGRLATCGRLSIGLPAAPIAPKKAQRRLQLAAMRGSSIRLPMAPTISLDQAFMWGRQSCLQPPFRRLSLSVCEPRKRRMKAGGSQDWLPHRAAHPKRQPITIRKRQADCQSAAGCQPAPHSFGIQLARAQESSRRAKKQMDSCTKLLELACSRRNGATWLT
jgi:hypothetical protein